MARAAAEAVMNFRRESPRRISMSSSLVGPVEFGGHFLEMRGEPGAELRLLGRRPLAKAFAGLEAEAAACDEVAEIGERPGRAVEIGEKLDMAVEGEVGAD